MKRIITQIFLYIDVLAGIGVSALLLWNYQMDEGVKAYKEGNDLVAIKKLSPLAHMGGKAAQLFVGEIYAFGSTGIPKNDEKAIYWFR